MSKTITLSSGDKVKRKYSHIAEGEVLIRDMHISTPDNWIVHIRPTDTGKDFEKIKKLAQTTLAQATTEKESKKTRKEFAAAHGWTLESDHHGKYWVDEDGMWVAEYKFDPETQDLS